MQGRIIGIYEIVDDIPRRNKYHQQLFKGRCIYCGFVRIDTLAHLKFAHVCQHRKITGEYKDYKNTSKIDPQNKLLYKVLADMKTRCYNPNNYAYKWYGGKGVYVYDEWMKDRETFFSWAWGNGYRPGLTIDRIDCNGPYIPSNCRWITMEDNVRNKPTTHFITVNGTTLTGAEWNNRLGVGIINVYWNKYGETETAKFIEWFINHPEIKECRKHNQSYYLLYLEAQHSEA